MEELQPLKPGDEGYVDPVLLEQTLLKAEDKPSGEIDPVEMASMILTLYTPRFHQLVDGLSGRQLKRVLKSIVEYPVGQDYKHPSKEEKEVFALGTNLMDAKQVLVINTYNENREQIMAQAADARKLADEATKNMVIEHNNEEKEVING
jgi:hypothetical protein